MADLGWVEQLTGLTVVDATESTFVLTDGTQRTEHTIDGNLIARLKVHGVTPPWPWPRVEEDDDEYDERRSS